MEINFAKAILQLRYEMNLSQVELANLLKVSSTSVNRWENNKHQPTKLAKIKIINLLEENKIKELN